MIFLMKGHIRILNEFDKNTQERFGESWILPKILQIYLKNFEFTHNGWDLINSELHEFIPQLNWANPGFIECTLYEPQFVFHQHLLFIYLHNIY